MIKYLVVLLPLLLLIPPPAHGYYMDYMGFVWDSSPLICIWDSDYNGHATTAVTNWYDALGDEFKFNTLIVTGEVDFEILQRCNIHIIYVEMEYASAEELDTVTGRMSMKIGGSIAYIYVFEAGTYYPNLEAFDNSIIRTTMHEIGHGFGLGHVIAENDNEEANPPSTLMWSGSGAWTDTIIGEQTLLAFRCLYVDAWEGNHPDNCNKFDMDLEPTKQRGFI